MNPKVVELKAHIRSQIQNYEEFPQLITSFQASHAWVFKSMDVIMCTHAIPSIGTLTEVKTKNQAWLELDLYFEQLMRITTSIDLKMIADTMHQYVVGPATLKTMMCMLYDELDRGAKSVYSDSTEVRVFFQKDVNMEYADTITNYQGWHQFTTINHQEDVDDLDFPQLFES